MFAAACGVAAAMVAVGVACAFGPGVLGTTSKKRFQIPRLIEFARKGIALAASQAVPGIARSNAATRCARSSPKEMPRGSIT